ncbi:helix-turn-helix transcriptional regulator [Rhodocytophaga rosea]|uniref:Helix-turn-helix transcriptional regulator n=1 Tax=Rhodocytophaga rosea TaxID=2704465 RepID=A0A6C0GT79_9BACT|nr:AraC family transcriptional regulator [Rhodocytophaga rosea]QHT70670.1 helix-turn-helix transcriptional regulator [Rhodocytophaga rosea]
MEKSQSLEEFYLSKLQWLPPELKKEMGHFNVFRLDEFVGPSAKPIPYSRKNYYKISLIVGKNRIHYADKVVEIEKQALLFANPHVPYNWESLADVQSGYFCIYTESFFEHFGNIKDYPMFKPGGNPIFVLTDTKVDEVKTIFLKMQQEITSDFVYKYNVLRNLVFELIHAALKMKPATSSLYSQSNASLRVSSLFIELLERQFPIESPMQRISLRSPAAFADQLAVHVNHLNRSLKETTGKTTSQLINERVIQEARALLKHTDWNISQIAWCLGFEETPHFINFFKKSFQTSPASFRKAIV